jgi:hypothetical protein
MVDRIALERKDFGGAACCSLIYSHCMRGGQTAALFGALSDCPEIVLATNGSVVHHCPSGGLTEIAACGGLPEEVGDDI